jgi:hypothetical protein
MGSISWWAEWGHFSSSHPRQIVILTHPSLQQLFHVCYVMKIAIEGDFAPLTELPARQPPDQSASGPVDGRPMANVPPLFPPSLLGVKVGWAARHRGGKGGDTPRRLWSLIFYPVLGSLCWPAHMYILTWVCMSILADRFIFSPRLTYRFFVSQRNIPFCDVFKNHSCMGNLARISHCHQIHNRRRNTVIIAVSFSV